ncbi:MAG: MopE-related protein [Myxococcota bacterium]
MILWLFACGRDTDKPDVPDDTVPTDTGDPCAPVTWFADGDGDGFGGAATVEACDAPEGYVATSGDCDDADPAVSPDLPEVCDAADVDEDCSGAADDDDEGLTDAITWYRDYDADGYATGNGVTITQCDPPAGYASALGDCDDEDESIHPGAQEVCDPADTDEDCDGAADDADESVDPSTRVDLYGDADGDGFGGGSPAGAGCDATGESSTEGSDCDDADASVHPAATETCDGRDDDCDGLVDDGDDSLDAPWYGDGDGDGYGDAEVDACEAPAGYVAAGGDCDDADAGVNPGAAEVCLDVVDQDCDGLTDDYTGACEPVVDGAVADLCDPAVVAVDAAYCTEGVAAVLPSGVPYPTVQDAVDAAAAGDVVTVCPGTWVESLDVTADLGLAGFGSGVSVLAPDRGSALQASDGIDLTVTDITVEGGEEHAGGGILLGDDGTLSACAVSFGLNTSDAEGGAVGGEGAASLTFDACTFHANEAGTNGGAVALDGEATIVVEDSAFVSNTAATEGGALWAVGGATVSVTNSVFEANGAGYGAAISFEGPAIDATAVTFEANVGSYAGAIWLDNDDRSALAATLDACVFEGNSGYLGGGLRLGATSAGTLSLTDTSFAGNTAKYGGAFGGSNGATWTITLAACTLTDNEAYLYHGGALYIGEYVDADVTLTDCVVTGNTAFAEGGGAWLTSGGWVTLTSVDSTWSSNSPDDVDGYTFGATTDFECDGDVCE